MPRWIEEVVSSPSANKYYTNKVVSSRSDGCDMFAVLYWSLTKSRFKIRQGAFHFIYNTCSIFMMPLLTYFTLIYAWIAESCTDWHREKWKVPVQVVLCPSVPGPVSGNNNTIANYHSSRHQPAEPAVTKFSLQVGKLWSIIDIDVPTIAAAIPPVYEITVFWSSPGWWVCAK